MKKINKILYVFVILCMMCLGCNLVQAKNLPNSINGLSVGDTLSYNGYDSMYYKVYSDGVAFCSSFHVPNVGDTCKLKKNNWNNNVKAGVAAIVDKYNSNPSKKNYYYAELALNEFLNYNFKKNSNNLISTTRDVKMSDGVKGFYDAALKEYQKDYSTFKVSLNTRDGKLTFKEQDGYYVSNVITVNGSEHYKIALSGSDNVEMFNEQDNSFQVRVPKDEVVNTTEINVVVTADRTIKLAGEYDCGAGNQTVVINDTYDETINSSDKLSGTIEIKIENKKTMLRIIKKDLSTQEVLKGAELEIVDSEGNITSFISDTTPYYKEGLKPGHYKLREVKAPEGYKLNDEEIEFDLEENDTVKEIVYYNIKNNKYKVKIKKQDITTKTSLSGATLLLKDDKGVEIAKWVTSLDDYVIELEPGNYVLTEVSAPDGYDLSYEVIKFSVGEDNEVATEVVMYNSKTPDTSDRSIILTTIITIVSFGGCALSIYKLKNKVR